MKIYLLILSIIFSLSVSATNYYVAKTGSNSNDGSLANPWLTLTYAESKMASGDDLYIRAGIYYEQLRIYGNAGTAGNHTTFQNYNDEEVIIDGTGTTLSQGSALVYASLGYIDISGLIVRKSNEGGMLLSADCPYSKIENCTVYENWQGGINVLSNYSSILNCTVYSNCMSNSDGIFSGGEFWNAGISLRGDYSVAKNNIVYDNWGEGLSCGIADNDTITGNTVYDNFSVNLYCMNSIGCVITRNKVYMTKTKGQDATSVGIAHWNEAYVGGHYNDNNTVAYNVVYNCRRNFYAYEPVTNTQIVNNTFVNSTYSTNIQLTRNVADANSIFKNNIIVQDDALPCVIASSGNSGISFSNNLYNKSYDADVVGANDVTDDPLFIDKANKNFQLTSSSPAINAGIDVGLTTDYLQNTIVGLPDIGAYEYSGEEPPVTPPAFFGGKKTISTGRKFITNGKKIVR